MTSNRMFTADDRIIKYSCISYAIITTPYYSSYWQRWCWFRKITVKFLLFIVCFACQTVQKRLTRQTDKILDNQGMPALMSSHQTHGKVTANESEIYWLPLLPPPLFKHHHVHTRSRFYTQNSG